MNWLDLLNEMIDMRSFSNLWFWIALAVMWSSASHWVLGVPYDMVLRAARNGDQAQTDLEDITRVNINRMLYIAGLSGLWLLGLGCFVLTSLALLGFVYDMQLAQAVFLLAFPMAIVGLLSLNTARLIRDQDARGAVLRKRLTRQRVWTQVIGMIAIFVTALWGMYQNLTTNLPNIQYRPLGELQIDVDVSTYHSGWRTRGV